MKKPSSLTTSGHVFKRINAGSGPAKLINEIANFSQQDKGKRASTLGELIDNLGMHLVHTCADCGHVWKDDSAALLADFGPDCLIKDVQRDCPVCGSTRIMSMPSR